VHCRRACGWSSVSAKETTRPHRRAGERPHDRAIARHFGPDQGLTRAYPGVIANDAVSFDIRAGEVHALRGGNGAGKSTLVKMIYGLVKPDSGTMSLRGVPFAPANPSAGERQRVEIIRCLLQEPQILVMDEPTSVLTPQEAEILFATLRRLVAGGDPMEPEGQAGSCQRSVTAFLGGCLPRKAARGVRPMVITVAPIPLAMGGCTGGPGDPRKDAQHGARWPGPYLTLCSASWLHQFVAMLAVLKISDGTNC
jgi:hypothetical protein